MVADTVFYGLLERIASQSDVTDLPLTIVILDRLKEGSTPLLNAVFLLLMPGSSRLALIMIAFQRTD